MPPMPVPKTMPKRSAFTSPLTRSSAPMRPASRRASPVAATAKWVLRSWRRASLASMYCADVEALHLAGHVDLERRRVEQGDAVDARATGHERVPRGIGADADR